MGDYQDYNEDVQRIKSAILFSQHKAAKSVNANELELYMAIGSFVSIRTRTQAWGHGAINAVSSQLQKELPGLRGFSPRNLRLMRTFYEEWSPYLPSNEQLQNLELMNSDTSEKEPALVVWNFQIPNHNVFPIAEFLSIGFTQHRWILSLAKNLDERLFYIKRAAHEHYRVEDLKRSIRNDDYHHQAQMPNKKRIQFIWSHSALKEGWDNPNVFQICTLVETKDTMTKRQKVGRGLRLCVDQDGERCYDEDANVLTVIANESYDAFASGLQSEFEKDGFKFGVLTPESFTKVTIEQEDGQEVRLGFERSAEVYQSFVTLGLVDKKGNVTPELKEAAEKGCIKMPAGLEAAQSQVEDIILHKAAKLRVTNKQQEVSVQLDRNVADDPAFLELWDRIRRRTRFEVDVDSDKLVERAIEEIRKMPSVRPIEILSTRADLSVGDGGVDAEATGISVVSSGGTRMYDLPDPIAELQDAVGLTRRTILRILEGCGRMDEFAIDPATFLAQVAQKIEKAKGEAIEAGIKYVRRPEDEWYTMRDLEPGELKGYVGQNAWQPSRGKSLYSYVVYDSSTVELPFAQSLDLEDEVRVFAKLPSRFRIDTPIGPYNPDWAYVVEYDGEQRVYFCVETKGGGNNTIHAKDSEWTKIHCAEKHFEALGVDIEYLPRTTYR